MVSIWVLLSIWMGWGACLLAPDLLPLRDGTSKYPICIIRAGQVISFFFLPRLLLRCVPRRRMANERSPPLQPPFFLLFFLSSPCALIIRVWYIILRSNIYMVLVQQWYLRCGCLFFIISAFFPLVVYDQDSFVRGPGCWMGSVEWRDGWGDCIWLASWRGAR